MHLLQRELLLMEKAIDGRFSSSRSLKYIFYQRKKPYLPHLRDR